MSRVLIMAGGTGGHVIPGLAVASALRSQGADVCWLGTASGLESTLVPAADIPLHTIAGRGLRGSGWSRKAAAPFNISRSLWQACLLMRRLRPAVVLGMGGYASGPGGLAAWLLRIPLIIHEQNRITGLTNRLLRPLARAVFYGLPPVTAREADSQVVGNPVPETITPAVEDGAGDDRPLRILVLGGSQGARTLNGVVARFFNHCDPNHAYQLWHQCGARLVDETRALYADQTRVTPPGEGPANGADEQVPIRVDGFIDDMAAAYGWADLVIARAGALTISELCLARKPSILVPLPSAVDDHQTANASYLVEQGAAVLLPQRELDEQSLQRAIESFRSIETRQAMAAAAGSLARRDAAQRVARSCLEWCHA
ncbi:MAG: undecaprenyldiphospho-muramoylpentapeptide beta-N-acetylglucosaminyltransferase [Gammaproteobacteria bacterium]